MGFPHNPFLGGVGRASDFLLISWILAWSRFAWFQSFQNHTFFPIWIGYVVVINALSMKRTGKCLLTAKPRYYLSLFPLSAGFWWTFEFLNRFVRNWYYLGSIELDATMYFWIGTISFSTVLPAIVGTHEYLRSFPHLRLAFENWTRLSIPQGPTLGLNLLIVAVIGLVGIGIWPRLFYPLVWVSPLLLIVGIQQIWGRMYPVGEIREGRLESGGLTGVGRSYLWSILGNVELL